MNEALLTAAAGAALLGTVIGILELRWRRLVGAELPSEVPLGILAESDVQALRGWRRFRGGWLSDARERRAFCRIAGKLACAKAAQRKASGSRSRLLQVEVLTLRTRLRQLKSSPRWNTAADGGSASRLD